MKFPFPPQYHLLWSDFDVPGFFLHACARTDHSVSEIIIFKSAAGSISFRSTVSQSCSIHACVAGHRRAAAAPRMLRWRCRRLAAACPVRLVGDIRHATAVFHKVFGQENKPGAPVTSSQGARDTNVRPPNRACTWISQTCDPFQRITHSALERVDRNG